MQLRVVPFRAARLRDRASFIAHARIEPDEYRYFIGKGRAAALEIGVDGVAVATCRGLVGGVVPRTRVAGGDDAAMEEVQVCRIVSPIVRVLPGLRGRWLSVVECILEPGRHDIAGIGFDDRRQVGRVVVICRKRVPADPDRSGCRLQADLDTLASQWSRSSGDVTNAGRRGGRGRVARANRRHHKFASTRSRILLAGALRMRRIGRKRNYQGRKYPSPLSARETKTGTETLLGENLKVRHRG